MAPLTTATLLDIWERGRRMHPIDRALRLVTAVRPEVPAGELAQMTLGDRDAALLALHEALFGTDLPCVADCAACGERLEFDLSTTELRTADPVPESAEFVHAGRTLRLRPLNSRDLAAVADAASADQARLLLARRSLVDEDEVELSDEFVEGVSERLAEIDQRAEVLLDLTCPTCGRQWQQAFDVEAYVWRELSAEAVRLLREVHTLARAYGWREADILAMSATRRQAYVELAG